MKALTLSPTMALIYYQARLIWRVNLWIAPIIALLLPVVLFLPAGPEWERVYWALRISETFAPIIGILICANLVSQEWENHMANLWLTKSFPRQNLLLARLAVAVVITILVLLLLFAELHVTYAPLNWGEALFVVLPPTLFLGMLGMTVGLIVHSSAIAFLVPLIYWFFEQSTKGTYTGPFYLFARASVPCNDTPAACVAASASAPWMFSKLLVLGLTVVLVTLALWLLQRTGRPWRS
ncbi:MAG: hypothetical protein ACLFVO_06670 [Chloroflexaceae bacterium]